MHCSLDYHEFEAQFCRKAAMTLVQLRHLISLAQTGSFSQSAAALFLTQPALSRSIRALEDELGQPLFDRIGRRSELTPFGRDAVERARELVLAADDLRDSARGVGDGHEGVLRIGMGSGPGAMLMTPLLLKMAQERPRLRVEVARAGTELLVQALRERALDALVVDARSLRPAPDLHAQFMHDMRGAFMVRPRPPLDEAARRPELRRAAALSDRLDAAVGRGRPHPGRALRRARAPSRVRDAALRRAAQPGRGGAAKRYGAAGDPRGGARPRRTEASACARCERAIRPRDAEAAHAAAGVGGGALAHDGVPAGSARTGRLIARRYTGLRRSKPRWNR
jgi:DNA-binding transcriptional LysR family regulator